VTSEPIRDPLTDQLLTPQNCALIIIDYQPVQVNSIMSMDKDVLVDRILRVAKIGATYELPTVLSTVNVNSGRNKPTLEALTDALKDVTPIDRTTMNAWEDIEFKQAVQATGRRKLVMCALWTEVCLTFPCLDAIHEGFEVYPVVDAVGGTSVEAHRAGLARIYQAGGKPSSVAQLLCELQRDWARQETVDAFTEQLLGGPKPLAL
jgi:nicotinamidase-related amidase